MTITSDLRSAPRREPIELRLADRNDELQYVLWASVNDAGIICYSMTRPTGSTPNALSNLQHRSPFPRKAVKGWQHEALLAASSGLYRVSELR